MTDHPFLTRGVSRLAELVETAARRTDRIARRSGAAPGTAPAAAGPTGPARRAGPRRAVSAPRPAGLMVALSGGPDSVALLLVARAWAERTGAPLEAAHLNHGLRGADADADEAFCRELCARLGVPLHVSRADPRPLARRRGCGLEEAGRALRRRQLRRLLAERPHLACAATGHHRDDQAETVVMRLFRGAGLDGLAGIRPVAGPIVHPLLDCGRDEILAFLADAGQPYRVDVTNDTGSSTRSRVRRELLPLARDIFGPGALAGPARLPEVVAGDAVLLRRLARRAARGLLAPDEGPAGPEAGPGARTGPGLEGAEAAAGRDGTLAPPVALDVPGLLALERPLARRVVRRWLAGAAGSRRDLGWGHVESLLDWLASGRSGGGLDLPGGWRAVREFDRLRLTGPGAAADLPLIGSCHILVARHGADAPPPPALAAAAWILTMPAGALRGEPCLRAWRPGDRLCPLGLGGHKKVSDLLRERRLPRRRRAGHPVVADEAGLLWVVGLARDERTRWLPGTRDAVTLAVHRAAERTPDAASEA